MRSRSQSTRELLTKKAGPPRIHRKDMKTSGRGGKGSQSGDYQPLKAVGVAGDITSRKRAQGKRRR